MGTGFHLASRKSFAKINKTEIDYLILGEYSVEDIAQPDKILPERVILSAQSLTVREIIPPIPVKGKLVIETSFKN